MARKWKCAVLSDCLVCGNPPSRVVVEVKYENRTIVCNASGYLDDDTKRRMHTFDEWEAVDPP